MQFYDISGTTIDTSPGINLINFRKNYLISVLHCSETTLSDINPSIQWDISNGVYTISKDYSEYKNVICIPQNNYLISPPIYLSNRLFTIDFWMKVGIAEDLTDTIIDYQTKQKSVINRNIKIDIYSDKDLEDPFLSFYYNGRRICEASRNSNEEEPYATYFSYSSNSSITDWYTLIHNNPDNLHHFAISYIFGQLVYNLEDTTRSLTLWLDGLLENNVDSKNLKYNGNMKYILIKIINTDSQNMYISNFRIFDGVALHKIGESFSSYGTSFSRNFTSDLEDLKTVKSKQIYYYDKRFLSYNDTTFFKPRISDIKGYKPVIPNINFIPSSTDLVFFPFTSENTFESMGSLNDVSLLYTQSSKGTSSIEEIDNQYQFQLYDNTIKFIPVIKLIYHPPQWVFSYSEKHKVSGNLNTPDYWEYRNHYNNPVDITQFLTSNNIIPLSILNKFTLEFFTSIPFVENMSDKDFTYINFSFADNSENNYISTNITFNLTHEAYIYNGNNLKYYENGKLIKTITEYTNNDINLKIFYINKKQESASGKWGRTSGLSSKYTDRQINCVFGYLRISSDILYTDEFDPSITLATDRSGIIEYLNSSIRDPYDNKILLQYPVKNPDTYYDIIQSPNAIVKLKPHYNTTINIDYDDITTSYSDFPTEYNGCYSVFSVSEEKYNRIIFQVDKTIAIPNYTIDFWLYIRTNFSSSDYIEIFTMLNIKYMIQIFINSQNKLKLNYGTGDFLSLSSVVTTSIYDVILNDQWNHIVLNMDITNLQATLTINNNEIAVVIINESYLRQLILNLGKRRTDSLTPYFVGFTVKLNYN